MGGKNDVSFSKSTFGDYIWISFTNKERITQTQLQCSQILVIEKLQTKNTIKTNIYPYTYTTGLSENL